MPETKTLRVPPLQSVEQMALKLQYSQLAREGKTLPDIHETGFRIFSQNDEDGILLFIFAVIGTSNKQCIEIGCGHGLENNTANLIINHGFHGLLIDGSADNISVAQKFFTSHPDSKIYPPYLLKALVTDKNVNDIIRPYPLDRHIDLLSLDIDSIDFYVLSALAVIKPRVLVIETPTICGPTLAKVVPNDLSHSLYNNPNFYGASLLAYTRMLKKKGYRLVGVNKYATNAFFILEELATGLLPTKAVEECFFHPRAKENIISRWEKSKDLPWIDVPV